MIEKRDRIILVIGVLFFAILAVVLELISSTIVVKADMAIPEFVYPDTGEIVELVDDDIAVFETSDGNRWMFKDNEDWFIGEKIAVVFNDSGTHDRSDDWILMVRHYVY